MGDDEYLGLLSFNLKEALDEFSPDIVYYNAGNDHGQNGWLPLKARIV